MATENTRRLLSISVPVYNEEDNIERLLERLRHVLDRMTAYDYEIVFTDNASSDSTFDKLVAAARDDPRIRVLRFSRNYGFQQSIRANYLEARGDAAVQIDADLEDPPELIPEMVRLWESGYKVVYGIRRKRAEFILLSLARKAFYWFISVVSDTELPRDAGDFRLVDRVVIEALRQTRDHSPYLRGLIAAFGFAQTGILYDRSARLTGKSKFHAFALMRLAIDGICSQTTRPLEFITLFGFALSTVSILGAGVYTLNFFFHYSQIPQGFTTLVFVVLVTQGFNAAFLGMLGEYIGRIYNNSRTLPTPIIEFRVEHKDSPRRHPADDIGSGS